MHSSVRKYLAEIGRKGGQKSRRKLTTEQAKRMVLVRELRRVYREFYGSCFWSFDPAWKPTEKDREWIVKMLRKNGGRKAWYKASQLCLILGGRAV